jgi:GTP-binding protein HflX
MLNPDNTAALPISAPPSTVSKYYPLHDHMSRRGTTAIIAKRTDEQPIDTAEIRALAMSAGYDIVGELTQVRKPAPNTEFGAGRLADLAALVSETGADVVIVDNDLDPNRTFALRDRIDCEVIDRKRLVLDVFADRANTRRARLEVRLAELQYELPLAEERAKRGEASGRMGFKSRGESPAERIRANYRRQIRDLETQLDEVETSDDRRRTDRHEAGFDLVALAGYTNAGKSTLLRRLADDLAVDENEDKHADLDRTAESKDQLFTTLDTTTRRATLSGRRLLLTDTVGFISGLPHWLVDSFESTLTTAYTADAVCLVIDGTDDTEAIREKTGTSLGVLREHRDGEIVPIMNKADIASALEEKAQLVASITDAEPVVMSALTDDNFDALAARLGGKLQAHEQASISVPNSEEAMSLVSWIYDHADVDDITYDEEVTVEFNARPEVVEQARGRAQNQLD